MYVPLRTVTSTFITLLLSPPCSCSQPSTGRSRTTQQDLEHRVEKAWKAITICFKARYAHPYDSTLLSTLSPLLVAMLNSSSKQLSGLSLSFWAVTFDKAKALDYPARLRDYFIRYLKDLKQPSELKLPGFHSNHKTLASINKEIVRSYPYLNTHALYIVHLYMIHVHVHVCEMVMFLSSILSN